VKLGDILNHNNRAYRQAREVFTYRLLLACGAAVAAMSGADALVFSGRYAQAARDIAPWLISRLRRAAAYGKRQPEWRLFTDPVEKIAAEMAGVAYLAWSMRGNRREPCNQT